MYDSYRDGFRGGGGGGGGGGGNGGGNSGANGNTRSYAGTNSSYRTSRSRSRQRSQKAGEMIAGMGSTSYGAYGSQSNNTSNNNNMSASSSGITPGFLPAARDGVRTPGLSRSKRDTASPRNVGDSGGRISRSRQGMRGTMGMAGAGSRALAGGNEMNTETTNENRNTGNVNGGRSSKSNNNSLPLIGGTNSDGVPAAVPAASRRHRHRNSGQVPVHTGTPNTKTEKSVRAGCHSIEGVKPGNANWSNQDNFFLVEDVSPSLHIWGVFDGHGGDGHHVSKICRERFPKIWNETDQNMPAAFKQMQTELEKAPCDARCAGATAVVVVSRNNKLEVGNCGDSRAVLGRRKSGQVTAVGLTVDHKPDRPDERRRVLAAGGQVGSRQLVVGHNSKGPVTMPLGPARVWYTTRGETMGLAMSRSLGDCIVHTMGVSADPEMSEHACDNNDLFLIIATDGIWDVIESAQAVQLVAQHLARATAQGGPAAPWDVTDASTVLATTARKRWESLSPMVDDITAIVVDLRPVHPSA
mmetsp:Transcript_4345/g.5729  ORF Transcript_4345/g.5729 Transcript_4345/m.5729 type:complete len:526 (-) Transcript_4345:357-1934(-)|eukprot:CAMPEP_0114365446 /NCGR_PEP_ID=MMETSP0101-20121206/28421_1 /TAXON_ID=38822 ORGANISM="Pteridomonas danica, Strain PT" /NCGR_SAMPLE_ID=MMETSP0101 /ASSEMBLY_ACC=CAM_ASM_000211 /LENGTH=525 /DNA_ID=CAMNT_0001513789 /DNA_START=121 /DNA_END=1698 /DNA_ORIENTATION=+